MDLIDCNGHLGIDIVCTGLDARIAVDKDTYNGFPLITGIGAYAISAVVNVLHKGIGVPTVVDCGDLHFDGETALVCVCSGRYYGGGFMPVGDNMPDDGLLEVLVVRKVSRLTFFRLVSKYGAGKYRDYPDLIWYRQGHDVTVKGQQKLVAVVDGEPVWSRELRQACAGGQCADVSLLRNLLCEEESLYADAAFHFDARGVRELVSRGGSEIFRPGILREGDGRVG